jgi:CzcA family heavy metal efflux pump
MLGRLIGFSLRHALWVVLAGAALLVGGVISLGSASYDVFPEFVPAQVIVQAEAPGFSATQVERLVTQPLENAINGGSQVDVVRSESIQGLAVVTVLFKSGSDPFRDRELLSERINAAAAALPQGVQPPSLSPMTSSTMDLLKIGFTSDKLDPIALRTLVDWTIKPRLLAVPGVAEMVDFGGGIREWQIRVHPARLATFGLSLDDVRLAAAAATGVRGGGYVDTPNQRIVLETNGVARSADTLASAVITQRAGRNVTLGDVADVVATSAPAFGDARIMGKPGVLAALTSQYGANTLEATRLVEAALAEFKPMLDAQGVHMEPALHRPASFITIALANMRNALLIGAALVLLVLVVFLRDWRTALISFVSIPLSLALATLAMRWLGWTINTMTLGGLAVALGVVVDDAIIDVENIMRRLRQPHGDTSRAEVILAASMEVRRPIVLATLVVGLVFLPIILLPDLQGSFFAPLAGAFLLATFASLLVALTVTPALSVLLLGGYRRHREPRWLLRLKICQHRVLARVIHFPGSLLALSLLLGVAAAFALGLFGAQLLPSFREGHYVIQIDGAPATSLSAMTQSGEQLSKEILAIDGIATVSLQIGRAEAVQDTWPTSRGELHVELKPALSASAQGQIERKLRDTVAAFPGLSSEVVTFLGDRIGESMSGESAPVVVNIYGARLSELDRLGDQAVAILAKLPDAGSVRLAERSIAATMRVNPDPVRLAAHGLRMTDVLDAVAMAYEGTVVAETYDGVQPIGVRVRLDEGARQDPEAVGELLLHAASGANVALQDVANVDLVEGRSSISHEGGRRRTVITVEPDTDDVVGYADSAKAALAAQLKLPAGYYVEINGAAEGAVKARQALILHSAFAAVGIVVLLFMAFPDPRRVALVLVNLPFALVGGVIAAALTGAVLSIGALVGLVTLFGIAARNTIMLISHYDHLVYSEGAHWNRFTAQRGIRERFTPIMMTALVTALGLLPLALGNGEAGREVEGPMAVVILGGLASSTLLNLVVVPALAHAWLRFTKSQP